VAARKSREKRISGIKHLKATKMSERAKLEAIQHERHQIEGYNANLEKAILGESIKVSDMPLEPG